MNIISACSPQKNHSDNKIDTEQGIILMNDSELSKDNSVAADKESAAEGESSTAKKAPTTNIKSSIKLNYEYHGKGESETYALVFNGDGTYIEFNVYSSEIVASGKYSMRLNLITLMPDGAKNKNYNIVGEMLVSSDGKVVYEPVSAVSQNPNSRQDGNTEAEINPAEEILFAARTAFIAASRGEYDIANLYVHVFYADSVKRDKWKGAINTFF
jgi:hypothetical protein